MPKVVDPDERRGVIADALFDIIRERGFSKITLANVAERAGLAIGSVRHFLGTREEMIAFAFDTISDRFGGRILTSAQALGAGLDSGQLTAEARLQATADLLCEFLPLDATRRDEAVVWIEFETAARTDPHLAERSRRAGAQTTGLIERILESARERGAISSDIDLAIETARLAALIDGLTIRCALHPDLLSPDTARRAVVAHLREIRRSASEADPR